MAGKPLHKLGCGAQIAALPLDLLFFVLTMANLLIVLLSLCATHRLQGSCLHQLEFARQVHGGHRAAAAAAPGSGQEEVQALQVGHCCGGVGMAARTRTLPTPFATLPSHAELQPPDLQHAAQLSHSNCAGRGPHPAHHRGAAERQPSAALAGVAAGSGRRRSERV